MKRLTLTALSLIICLNDNLYSSDVYIDKDDKNNSQKSLSHIDDSDDIDFHHISNVPDFALTEFTSDDHKTLKVGILGKDNILFECLDPKVLSDIEPSMFRPLSGRNFLSNIKKVNEINLNDILPGDINGTYNFAEYMYQNSYGLNNQKIYLLCGQHCSEDEFKKVKEIFKTKSQFTSKNENENANAYYATRAFSNFFQTGSYPRLRPSALATKLKHALTHEFGQNYWQPSTCQYNPGNDDSPIFQYAANDQGVIIVTNPVHDLGDLSSPMEKVSCGNLSFQQAWQALKEYQFDSSSSNMRIFMPLGESNTMAGLKRNHWTTLMFTKNGSNWEATLNDSKGFLDSFYSRQTIADALAKEGIKLNYNFFGHQGFRNNSDCGYFSIAYILKALQGKNIADLTNQELSEKFIEFNIACAF